MLQIIQWQDWLSSGALVLALIAVIGLSVAVRRSRRQLELLQQLSQQHRMQYDQGLNALQNASLVMGRKLAAMEAQLDDQARQQGRGQESRSEPSQPSLSVADDLSDAVSLLRAGVGTDEVARRCGISRAEASLMQMMNRANVA